MKNKVAATMSRVLSESRPLQRCTRSLRWACASAAFAVLLAGCGGGGGPTLSPQAQEQRDQTSAATQAQQSVTARIAAYVQPGSASENFELGMGDWQLWGYGEVRPGAGINGSHALQICGCGGSQASGASLRVPGVVAGTTYRLTAQVRVSDPTEPAYLGVDFYNASGSRILQTQANAQITNTEYRLFTYDVVAPADTAYALVWFRRDGKPYSVGVALLDDLTFSAGFGTPPPPPLPRPTSNLLANGGFEAGMAGWVDWGNTHVVASPFDSGASALSVGPAAGGAGFNVDGIVPGTTYRLAVTAKVSDASETVYVGVNFLDQAGSVIVNMVRPNNSTSQATLTGDVTAPAGAVRAMVYVWKNAGSGMAYVDDFALGVVSGPTAPAATGANLLLNGSFENGLASWVNWGNATTSGDAATGTSAAQVGAAAGGFGQIVGNVVPGKTYRMSAQVKVTSPDEIAYLGLKFMDAAGNSLQDGVDPFSATAYTSAQVDLVAPPGAATALVYVWKNAGAGFALVDDVSLASVAPASSSFAPVTASPTVLANTSTTGRDVVVLTNGTRLAAWSDDQGVHTQRIDALGGLVGSPVLIAASGKFSGLTALVTGGYVVQYDQAGAVLAQMVDKNGDFWLAPVVLRTQAQVVADTSFGSGPRATLVGGDGVYRDAVGGFVATWSQSHPVGLYTDCGIVKFAQRFDSVGVPHGSPVSIGGNCFSTLPPTTSVTSIQPMTSGGLITSTGAPCCNELGPLRASTWDGGLNQTLIPVDAGTGGRSPDAAALANGGYVVIWTGVGKVLGQILVPKPGTGIAAPGLTNGYLYPDWQDVTPPEMREAGSAAMTFPNAGPGARVTALATGGFLLSWGTSAQAYSAAGFPIGEVVQILDGKITATPEGGFIVVTQVGSQLVAQQYVVPNSVGQ